MSIRAPDLGFFTDLSNHSVIPDAPARQPTPAPILPGGSVASVPGAPLTLDKNSPEAKKEAALRSVIEAVHDAPIPLALVRTTQAVEIMLPNSIGTVQSGKPKIDEFLERVREMLARSAAGRSYLRLLLLANDCLRYAHENKCFYGSSSAAATVCFIRFDAIHQTGAPGVALAGLFWSLILVLGNEFDRLRKLIAAERAKAK